MKTFRYLTVSFLISKGHFYAFFYAFLYVFYAFFKQREYTRASKTRGALMREN